MTQHDPEEIYQTAFKMYSGGADDLYIELQFAERGIDKSIVQAVMKRISKDRMRSQRARGVKFMIGGLATVAVGVLLSLITFGEDSPMNYIPIGVFLAGFMSFAKGIIDMF